MKPGQTELAQPFADRALLNRDTKAAGNFVAQIRAPPANDVVHRGVWTRQNQGVQLLHLRRRQLRCRPRRPTRHQAGYPNLIVTMHPITQRLPIHPGLSGGVLAAAALKHHRNRQKPPALRRIPALDRQVAQLGRAVLHPSDCNRDTKPPMPRIGYEDRESNSTTLGNPPSSQRPRRLV